MERQLTGRQKAAILLVALGPELSSQVLKHLRDDDIERITLEILNMEQVSQEVQDAVVQETYELCIANEYITAGGINYAMDLLSKALGPQKATDLMDRLAAQRRLNPFGFIRSSDPAEVANFVMNEHPQAIALILAHLDPRQAANVLQRLDPQLQAEVAIRIATMDRTSPEIIDQVEDILRRKMASVSMGEFTSVGGVETLVKLLNQANRSTEKTILETVEHEMPELAEEIRKNLFVFENIVQMDDRSIQRVLRDVDSKDLALALKGASEEVKSRIFQNMSARAVQMLKEDMDLSGPVRLRNVEEAQQRIVNIIRRLDEAEEIVIVRGGGGSEREIFL